jgi:NAD(P)-dependent dehydrogenase (short-subunit alcohol dehydrogenase family)
MRWDKREGKTMDDLNGKVAVVTGAGSGIGRASALALAREGVSVVVADLDDSRSAAVAVEIVGAGAQAIGFRCDVASDDQFIALRDAAIDAFGQVDIVMNNVGVLAVGLPDQITIEGWRRIIEINLLSVSRSINAFLPDMVARANGHFVNTASTAGLYGYSYERLPYSATKGAVVALSEALALYGRPRGVGVTCLCPGPVATNIAEQIEWFGEPGPLHGPDLDPLQPDAVGDLVVSAIKADRFLLLTHAEVQEALIERAKDPEAFLNGQLRRIAEQDAARAADSS